MLHPFASLIRNRIPPLCGYTRSSGKTAAKKPPARSSAPSRQSSRGNGSKAKQRGARVTDAAVHAELRRKAIVGDTLLLHAVLPAFLLSVTLCAALQVEAKVWVVTPSFVHFTPARTRVPQLSVYRFASCERFWIADKVHTHAL